jgi:hypothetical protein
VPRSGPSGGQHALETLRDWKKRVQRVRVQLYSIGEGLDREIGVHMKKAQLGRWAPYSDV